MKTKRLASTLIILISLSFSLAAQQINPEEARLTARKFIFERSAAYGSFEEAVVQDYEVFYSGGLPALYVMNMQPQGFVVVTAGRNVHPVIGYSFKGTFTKNGCPPQLEEYLNKMAKQTVFAMQHKQAASREVNALWQHYRNTSADKLAKFEGRQVEPLLTSTWDQGNPYNKMCPADPAGPGGHCYAGCVATAMGQVANYFRWPLQGTGSYSYSCPPYGTLSVDYSEANYLWNRMPLYLGYTNIPVAEFLYHLGVSVDMVYGPNGSGMYNHKAAYSLRTYFKYSPETQYVYRDSTSMDWDSLLVSHLDQKIPMYYAGWSVPNINGHAFVCDGYQEGDYYHFNWGWSGSYDGYFYTDNLTPGGSNFNLAQELIINAFPDTVNYTYPYLCNGEDTLNSTAGTIDDGSGPVYPYENNSNCSWLIAPEDSVNHITIDFLRFKTDINDILTVYDGATTSDSVLGSYSGSNLPDAIQSSGDKMLITFTSDDTEQDEGFLLSYEAEIPVYCSGMAQMVAVADTFSDGSGPRDYHNGTSCLWYIKPDNVSEITLHFLEFNTETEHDPLKIYEGNTLIATFSGDTLPDPVHIESDKMMVSFSSNSSVTATGWTAYYTTDLTQIRNRKAGQDFNIYPNPAGEVVFIHHSLKGDQAVLSLFSPEGKCLLQNNINPNEENPVRLELNELQKGVYFVNIRDSNTQYFGKIVRR